MKEAYASEAIEIAFPERVGFTQKKMRTNCPHFSATELINQ
ncbi:hypothetical protein SPONL_1939 [uncultured Candidatus Thioglobus sp.]|nr:hypothetical protein SPONL_1939 [uncultured Candidatus Thioglobus sp.]